MENEQELQKGEEKEPPETKKENRKGKGLREVPTMRLKPSGAALLDRLSEKHNLTKSSTVELSLQLFEEGITGSLDVTLPALTQEVIALDHSVGILIAQLDHLEQVCGIVIACGHEQGSE